MMPYIPKARRYPDLVPENIGELTYMLTKLCVDYGTDRRRSFALYAEVIAALECAKLEYYRRVVSLHENKKQVEHGDVYPEEEA